MKKKTIAGLIAIVVIVAVVLCAGCVEKEEMEKVTPTPTPTPTPRVEATPTPTPTPAPEVAKIGDWIGDGRISICVNSFRYADIIYGEYPEYTWDDETPKAGNIFVIVDASIKNVGTEIISVNPLYVFITDPNDYQYEYSSSATYNLDRGIKLVDLTPGRTLRFEVVFEMPKDTEPKEFIWNDWVSVGVIQLQS